MISRIHNWFRQIGYALAHKEKSEQIHSINNEIIREVLKTHLAVSRVNRTLEETTSYRIGRAIGAIDE